MLNCLQVKSIFTSTAEELQEELNSNLITLGKRVQSIDFVQPLAEGFAANIIYWSQDVAATITTKCEETNNPDREPLFVAVLTETERAWVENAINRTKLSCQRIMFDKDTPIQLQDDASKEHAIYLALEEKFEQELSDQTVDETGHPLHIHTEHQRAMEK